MLCSMDMAIATAGIIAAAAMWTEEGPQFVLDLLTVFLLIFIFAVAVGTSNEAVFA
jgi:hypothetical protein